MNKTKWTMLLGTTTKARKLLWTWMRDRSVSCGAWTLQWRLLLSGILQERNTVLLTLKYCIFTDGSFCRGLMLFRNHTFYPFKEHNSKVFYVQKILSITTIDLKWFYCTRPFIFSDKHALFYCVFKNYTSSKGNINLCGIYDCLFILFYHILGFISTELLLFAEYILMIKYLLIYFSWFVFKLLILL